jgi:phage-related protein
MSLSVAAKLQKNLLAQDAPWIVLLELQLSAITLRLARNMEDVTWGGHVWTAFPFELDDESHDSRELPGLGIRVSNVLWAVQHYIDQADGDAGATVIVRVVNAAHLEDDAAIEEVFENCAAKTDARWVYLGLGAESPMSIRFPVSRNLTDFCRFIVDGGYGGIECGVPPGTLALFPTCDGTLAACRARGNSVRYGGEPGLSRRGYYA